MRTLSYLFCLFTLALFSCGDSSADPNDSPDATTVETPAEEPTLGAEELEIHPIYHGSVVVTQGETTVFIDPWGGAERYAAFDAPDLVLITHTHPDHLSPETLAGIDLSEATLVGPEAVTTAADSMPFADSHTMANGDDWVWNAIDVAAVPAYNIPGGPDAFHPEGKFNGYVLTIGGSRLYFSGDTEDVPEMRALEEIDMAFVCMNQPYTMTVEAAADAVLAFKPDVVYPYHYRNQDESKSDLDNFKNLIQAANEDIEVRVEDWYTEAKK